MLVMIEVAEDGTKVYEVNVLVVELEVVVGIVEDVMVIVEELRLVAVIVDDDDVVEVVVFLSVSVPGIRKPGANEIILIGQVY